MPVVSFTPAFMATGLVCPPDKPRIEYSDDAEPGLFVECRSSAKAVPTFWQRLRCPARKTNFYKRLGTVKELSLTQARKLARQLKAEHAAKPKQSVEAAPTLLDLNGKQVQLNTCPCCKREPGPTFSRDLMRTVCADCASDVYVTDWLRLHEGISDFGDNTSAMTRMMNAVEHLMLASFIQQVFEVQASALSSIAFVLDGPLAIFGEPAKLSQRIQALIYRVNVRLAELGLDPMIVIGLQKTGGVMDHALLLERFLPDGVIRVIDDEYRNRFITGGDTVAKNFGNETYYGQDFLFKTERGRIFNFALPYPFLDKTAGGGGAGFAKVKADLTNYGGLIERACDLIRHFEMDLYDNAIVPVALAHRHASISLSPGGKVLDLLVRSGLERRR